MIKINLCHKISLSSIKKSILKFKERLDFCTKQCLSTFKTSNKTTNQYVQETKEDSNNYPLNTIDIAFSITSENTQKKENRIIEIAKYIDSTKSYIKNRDLIFDTNPFLEKNIPLHLIHYNRLLHI